eukprot:COSAG02_NODE_5403_length_4357_cov_3.183185_7_plen_116_part_00
MSELVCQGCRGCDCRLQTTIVFSLPFGAVYCTHTRGFAASPRSRLQHRRAGKRDGDVRVVRFRSKATGRQMTIRVETEDDLIEEGDDSAAVESDEVHNNSKPDLGGWYGAHSRHM